MKIRIPTPGGVLEFNVDLVDESSPLLIGVDVLDRFRLQILTVSKELDHVGLNPQQSWRISLGREGGHVILPFDHGAAGPAGPFNTFFSTA
jgi:hypothetical protein